MTPADAPMGRCSECGGDQVRIDTDHPQDPDYTWYAYEDDTGTCLDCGARYRVIVDDDLAVLDQTWAPHWGEE